MRRWQQTFNVDYVPNNVVSKVFMAVTLDLRDDRNGIHPRDKHDVAYRLSRSGLAVAYGQQVEFQGPIVQNVTYTTGDQTICCQESSCPANASWTPSTVSSKSGLTITLTVPSECVGKQLYGLRYLWRESPCPFKLASIYSSTDANLPSSPYIKLF